MERGRGPARDARVEITRGIDTFTVAAEEAVRMYGEYCTSPTPGARADRRGCDALTHAGPASTLATTRGGRGRGVLDQCRWTFQSGRTASRASCDAFPTGPWPWSRRSTFPSTSRYVPARGRHARAGADRGRRHARKWKAGPAAVHAYQAHKIAPAIAAGCTFVLKRAHGLHARAGAESEGGTHYQARCGLARYVHSQRRRTRP